jgi:hypothetical protein
VLRDVRWARVRDEAFWALMWHCAVATPGGGRVGPRRRLSRTTVTLPAVVVKTLTTIFTRRVFSRRVGPQRLFYDHLLAFLAEARI